MMVNAVCPLCRRQFTVNEHLFYKIQYIEGRLVRLSDMRAYLYHGCLSNGVKKII